MDTDIIMLEQFISLNIVSASRYSKADTTRTILSVGLCGKVEIWC
jgi:hypothetical protein